MRGGLRSRFHAQLRASKLPKSFYRAPRKGTIRSMFEISVEKTIACAHRLFDYDGPCEALHGHNYTVIVKYEGDQLDRFGMLVDFTDVKRAFKEVLSQLDHKYLNELALFEGLSPSAENIAFVIYRELSKFEFERGRLSEVKVWETPTQVASYRP